MKKTIIDCLSEATGQKLFGMNVLSESKFIDANESILSKLFDSIGEKYNEIDFTEIEKSNGAFSKFKYASLIRSNIQLLQDIYSSDDQGTQMNKYINANLMIYEHLMESENAYVRLYHVPVIAVLYNTMVSTMIYSLAYLIVTTIRFITTNDKSEFQVMIDSVPKSETKILLSNLLKLAEATKKDIPAILHASAGQMKKSINESIDLYNPSAPINEAISIVWLLAIPAAALALTRLIPTIRELIYFFYHTRINMENALQIQIDLIGANIESLDQRRELTPGKNEKMRFAKIIARQKKFVDSLDKIKRFVAIKFDTAESQTKKAIAADNAEIQISKADYTVKPNSNDLMI